LTQPPNARTGLPDNELSMRKNHDQPAKDGAPGPLTLFRESLFARVLYKHLGKEAEITPLTVQDWKYEQRSYQIRRTYRIKTKEVELDVVLAVFSVEPEGAGQGRKWFVNLRESQPSNKTYTPLGEGVKRLRQHAIDWLHQKITSLNDGISFDAITHVDKTPWELLQSEDLKKRKEYRDAVHQAFASTDTQRFSQLQIFTRADDAGKWETVDGKIRVYLVFVCTLSKGPAHKVEAVIALDTKRDIDPAQFLDGSPQPGWNVASIVFTTVTPLGDRKGPPG
jgi:hypothetical protein